MRKFLIIVFILFSVMVKLQGQTYTVTTSINPALSGTTTGDGTYGSGTSVTVTATANTGYTFVNWTEGGTAVSTSASYSFSLSANRTLVANFSINSYTVATSSSPTAGGTTSGGGTFNYGTSVTVVATPNTGYSFVNWTEGGTSVSTSASYTFTSSANRSLVVNFSLNSYTVTTSSSPAGGGTTNGGGTFNYGTSVTVVATPNTGYTFVNWTEGGMAVSTSASYTFTLSANRTLVANFSLNSYTVATSSSPAGGGTTNGGGTFNYGTSITVVATPNTGYTFVNWTEGGMAVSTSASYTFTLSANRTLVANFSLNTYTVATSSSPTAGGTTSGGGTFNYGTSVTVGATPNTGYTFVNWTEGGTAVSTSASYNFTLSANRTLVANFSINSYTVATSSSPAGGGTTSGGGTFNYGTSVTVVATPNTGYSFVNWTEGGTSVSTSTSYSFTLSTNRTLIANFSLNNYTIATSSSPTTGGTTSGGGSYNYGASATVTATPATGYTFVNWTQGGSAVSTNASYTFTVNANRTLVANFSIITYTVTTTSNPTAGGTTSGAGSYNYGTSATVIATPATGYQFVNWTEGGTIVSTNVSYTFTVTGNRSIVAHFSLIKYSVSTSSIPSGGGSTSGGGIYDYGDGATVYATPATGYQFVNWTQGGSSVSTNSSYSFTVTGNRILVANFSLIKYSVSISSSPSGGGSASGGGIYDYGDGATVFATPATGYQFVNWTQGGSSVSTNSSYSFTVTGNRTLVANFSLLKFSVSTSSSPSGGGSTSGGGIYDYGDGATVYATPATGYQFINWTQGGSSVSTGASYTFTVTANRTLVANFTQATYTVTTSSIPSEGGTTTGGGGFNYGASVTISATPAYGYQFANWTEGGSSVSTSASYTFTVSASRNLLANFSQIPKVLNLTGSGGTALHNNDIIAIGNSDAGSFLITVEANAEWAVSESSLWLKAVKESATKIKVTFLENISVIDKIASLKVTTALDAEMHINVQQKARVSQLRVSKFENIMFYPNPAYDHASLYFGDGLAGKLRISIASLQGTLLQMKELTDIQANEVFELDIAGMRTGQYLIKVSNETGQKIFQMIKY